jgi:hypothetical protein
MYSPVIVKLLFLAALVSLLLDSSPVCGQSSADYRAAIRQETEAYFRDCVEHAYFVVCESAYTPREVASVLGAGTTSFHARPFTLSALTEKVLSFESVSLLSDTSNQSLQLTAGRRDDQLYFDKTVFSFSGARPRQR